LRTKGYGRKIIKPTPQTLPFPQHSRHKENFITHTQTTTKTLSFHPRHNVTMQVFHYSKLSNPVNAKHINYE